MKVLITGINGFVGSNLIRRIISTTDWHVAGIDYQQNNIQEFIDNNRFEFNCTDVMESDDWLKSQISECDVVLPLAAIANPKLYITEPLNVFELDFEHNLKIIRWTEQYKRRLIFPSTSEVYGMSSEEEFDEKITNLVYGPVHKVRWIYACSKQLLDRIIFAMGKFKNLRYTCIRPFNWIGPRLDSLAAARLGNSRVATQFIMALIENKPIQLVQSGKQRRCFTDIDDALDCLMLILKHEKKVAHSILNIGNSKNEFSIREFAELMRQTYAELTGKQISQIPSAVVVSDRRFYGEGYQDIDRRVPKIDAANKLLGWEPVIPIEETVRKTISYFLNLHDR